MPSRRTVLFSAAATVLGGLRAALAASPAAADTARFGRYGSPAARLDSRTLYVDPAGGGDHRTVRAAVTATPAVASAAAGWTLVLAAGTYRETVLVPADRRFLTVLGATGSAKDTVLVFDNAAGTAKPGGGTYGTSGSATLTVLADGFTAVDLTVANDWLRADHPGWTGTQAVAVKAAGDRTAFLRCRLLGHQDTLYADSASLAAVARQYYGQCYVAGDVDFVFGRATAVFDRCELRTLNRTDLASAPLGFVFAPSTARANPRGFLASQCTFTTTAAAGAFCLARPWVPSSDTTAWPMLTVLRSVIGAGINATAPYANMSSGYPWQQQRFAEYANTGAGAAVPVPANRPQLTAAQAALHTRESYLTGADGWRPWA
ncbi:pectinesterase family protein [Streptomyces sp. TLI_171]|uniref:pectinesterase family protein n=1 Tax=Streptomyces sp. TLI_171 TaxID=1938859 RepID=UPI000C189FE8|nr:pectinesterase family protein [Streptomyces sp. TLI_171]RKE23348.1 pectinesterase [Streptomyces sp. TLI_171]